MPKTAKIAISLPEQVLDIIEDERKESGESRSEFFRHAAELLLRYREEEALARKYVKGYQRKPETQKEIEAARQAAAHVLATEPWQ